MAKRATHPTVLHADFSKSLQKRLALADLGGGSGGASSAHRPIGSLIFCSLSDIGARRGGGQPGHGRSVTSAWGRVEI